MDLKNSVYCLIFVYGFINFYIRLVVTQCAIDLKTDMDKKNPPMILSLKNTPEYLYPKLDTPPALELVPGQEFRVYCPSITNTQSTKNVKDGQLLLYNRPLDPPRNTELIMCNCNSLMFGNETIMLSNLTCENVNGKFYNPIMKQSSEDCLNGERYEVGYDLGSLGFLVNYEFCHNTTTAKTLWAHSFLIPANQDEYKVGGSKRKVFKPANLYNNMQISRMNPYKLSNAYETVNNILQTPGAVDQYVSKDPLKTNFFSRGHLIANGDKFYKSEQDSTYFLANTVPMWQQVNSLPGNWEYIEKYIRFLSGKKNHNFDIWVGGIGTLELENKKIYLYTSDPPKIPVPRILYKCVVDKVDKEGLCFLVINNPYLTEDELLQSQFDFIPCHKYQSCDYFIPESANMTLGYTYCCNINDFYNSFKEELGLEDLRDYLRYDEMFLLIKT